MLSFMKGKEIQLLLLHQNQELLNNTIIFLPNDGILCVLSLKELLLSWSILFQYFQETDSRPVSGDIDPPAIPKRPSSSILETFRRERQLEELGFDLTSASPEAVPHDLGHVQMDLSPDLDDHMDNDGVDGDDDDDDDDFEPVYQEIDDNHESKYAPKRSVEKNSNIERLVPPQVRIERRVFPNPHLHSSSMVSSTTGSEETLHRHLNNQGANSAMSSSMEMTSSSETPMAATPKTPPTPAVPFLADVPPSSAMTDEYPYAVPHSTHTVSALATMPRRKKDNKIQIKVASRERNLAGTRDDSTTIPHETARGVRITRTKPPTPPMRRLPSWVSQNHWIYLWYNVRQPPSRIQYANIKMELYNLIMILYNCVSWTIVCL